MEYFVKVLHSQFDYLTLSHICNVANLMRSGMQFSIVKKEQNKKTKLVSINTTITSNEQKKFSFLIFMNLR